MGCFSIGGKLCYQSAKTAFIKMVIYSWLFSSRNFCYKNNVWFHTVHSSFGTNSIVFPFQIGTLGSIIQELSYKNDSKMEEQVDPRFSPRKERLTSNYPETRHFWIFQNLGVRLKYSHGPQKLGKVQRSSYTFTTLPLLQASRVLWEGSLGCMVIPVGKGELEVDIQLPSTLGWFLGVSIQSYFTGITEETSEAWPQGIC